MAGWHRGNREVWPDGVPATGRTMARNAVDAVGGGLYSIYLLRWDDGRARYVAFMSGAYGGQGRRERGEPLAQAHVLDLVTGEMLTVTDHDDDVRARSIKVTELPPAVLERWPTDEKGRYKTPGVDHSGGSSKRLDGSAIRAIVAQVTPPADPGLIDEPTLFGVA